MKPSNKIKLKSIADKIFGKTLVDRIYLYECIRRYKKAGVIFVHIPRSAGSSISKTLIGKRAGHFTAREIQKVMRNQFDLLYSFSVVRNPFDRLLSSYKFATSQATQDGAVSNPLLFEGPQFKTFDSFVNEWLVCQNSEDLGTLFKPQHRYVMSNGSQLVTHVGRYENLKDLEETLATVLNKKIKFGHINRSRKSLSTYSTETRKIIEDIYKDDFEIFSY